MRKGAKRQDPVNGQRTTREKQRVWRREASAGRPEKSIGADEATIGREQRNDGIWANFSVGAREKARPGTKKKEEAGESERRRHLVAGMDNQNKGWSRGPQVPSGISTSLPQSNNKLPPITTTTEFHRFSAILLLHHPGRKSNYSYQLRDPIFSI